VGEIARRLVVELIADPRGYTAGLQTAAKQTKVFGAEVDKATRGIVSGSGALHGFGRSLAFASGGFLAFEGVSKFLTDSVSAARDAGVAQASLTAQMKASGESFTENQGAIQRASLSLEKFGFTSEDSQKALAVLDRATGNVGKSIQLQGVAANIARARNISLSQAALILGKAYDGQTTSLKRLGVALPAGTKGMQAIYIAAQKFTGQAKAGTTEVEKFHAILHNTEVIIGTALLPTLNKFLGSLGKWLQKMNESGRLQKDVNEAVKTATGIFEGVAAVVKPLAAAFQDLGKAVGGTKNEVKLLAGVFVALKAAKVIGEITAVGSAAEASTGKVKGLRLALAGLRGGGPIAVTIAVGFELLTNKSAVDKFMSNLLPSWLGGGRNTTSPGDPRLARTFPGLAAKLNAASGGGVPGLTGPIGTRLAGPLGAVDPRAGIANLKIPGGIYGNTAAPLTAAQQRAIGLAAQPQNLGLLRAQAAHDQAAIDFAKKLRTSGRISNQKYVDEVTAYASDLQQTNSTIAGILQAARQKTVDAAKAAAAKTAAAAAKQKQLAQQKQQNILDRAQYAVDRTQLTDSLTDDLKALKNQKKVIQGEIQTQGATSALLSQLLAVELAIKQKTADIAAARKQRADTAKQSAADALQTKLDWAQLAVDQAGLTDTLTDDLKARQHQLAIINKEIAVHGKTLALEQQRVGFLQAIKDIRGQQADAAKATKDATDKTTTALDQANQSSRKLFKTLNATAFVNRFGGGLTREQKRRLEVGLAMTGPGGTLPAGHPGQFTAGITIHGGVHMHGVQDVPGLENQLAKRAKARPFVRRGARG
jgi:hypothetical protein